MAQSQRMIQVLIILLAVVNVRTLTIDQHTFECGPCKCRTLHESIHADCSKRDLISVPQGLPVTIVELNISNNHINYLNDSLGKYHNLQYLDVSTNDLQGLDINNFINLKNLEILNLQSNSLNLSPEIYPKSLFQNQRSLRQLFLHNNSAVYSGVGYPDETFSDLTALEELHIDGIHDIMFGQGFAKLTSLSKLLLEGNCAIGRISNESFMYFPTLRYLSLVYCGVVQIEPAAFSYLQNIHTLDLSNNRDLGIARAGLGLFGLQKTSVKVLKLNRLHRYHGTGVFVRKQDIEFMFRTKIEELHLDENRIELFDISVPTVVPPTLKTLFARDNMLLFGIYMLTASALKVQWADFSGQHNSYIRPLSAENPTNDLHLMSERYRLDVDQHQNFQSNAKWGSLQGNNVSDVDLHAFKDGPWPGNFTIPVPQNMTYLNVSYSKLTFTIHRIHFSPNNLRILDISHNFFSRWEGPVTGLTSLEYLDLSHNYCDYISDDISPHLPALKVLNISYNYLGYALTHHSFNGLQNLHFLIMSNNKLSKLCYSIFHQLVSLKYLDLSSNYLDSWDTDISHIFNLTELDLSNNAFDIVPENLQIQIDKPSLKHLKINLSNNPFKCNCQTLSSLEWMANNGKESIYYSNSTCTLNDGSRMSILDLDEIIINLKKKCVSYVGVMMGILFLIVLIMAIVISGLVYRYRWKLRYLYYLTLNRHRGYLSVHSDEEDFHFDAFVSYADKDRGFVVRDMRKILEEPEEQAERFRLCIHHRDFLAGEAIAANILKAINTSRKTVVILTRKFLRSSWCRYEVEMAKMESIYRGRNTLLIVVMEDIPVKDLPVDIVEVMRNDSYVEFTNDREGQEVFWMNLKRGIRQT